jgi:hypothetical protein
VSFLTGSSLIMRVAIYNIQRAPIETLTLHCNHFNERYSFLLFIKLHYAISCPNSTPLSFSDSWYKLPKHNIKHSNNKKDYIGTDIEFSSCGKGFSQQWNSFCIIVTFTGGKRHKQYDHNGYQAGI